MCSLSSITDPTPTSCSISPPQASPNSSSLTPPDLGSLFLLTCSVSSRLRWAGSQKPQPSRAEVRSRFPCYGLTQHLATCRDLPHSWYLIISNIAHPLPPTADVEKGELTLLSLVHFSSPKAIWPVPNFL